MAKQSFIIATILASALANVDVLAPPACNQCSEIALVWISGAHYTPADYTDIATTFQVEAAKNGLAAWVGIPELLFNTPTPGLVDESIKESVKKIQSQGYAGDQWFLAAHSLGGVLTQDFISGNSKDAQLFKAQVLLGSALKRDKHSIQSDGTTIFDGFNVPTLTIGGTKDGFTRISRVAEQYWHQVKNINAQQANLFPIVELDGVNHSQFASTNIPSTVLDGDLNPDVTLEQAHQLISAAMSNYVKLIVSGNKTTTDQKTTQLLAPLVLAMEQEGYTNLKPPCNTDELIAPESLICFKGCPWVQDNVFNTWFDASTEWNPFITLKNDDSFHGAAEVFPYHHPTITNSCSQDVTAPCQTLHISNTEHSYNKLNELKLEKSPLSAYEIKTKLKSNQFIHQNAGQPNADFQLLDKQYNECAKINQSVLDWALGLASTKATSQYQSLGTKMLFGKDKDSLNGGSWIIDSLSYDQNKSANTVTLTSKIVVTNHNNMVPIFKDMHYCKLLSPFRAMEWIYVDSLYAKDSLISNELFLQ